jgi:hypothetical protein
MSKRDDSNVRSGDGGRALLRSFGSWRRVWRPQPVLSRLRADMMSNLLTVWRRQARTGALASGTEVASRQDDEVRFAAVKPCHPARGRVAPATRVTRGTRSSGRRAATGGLAWQTSIEDRYSTCTGSKRPDCLSAARIWGQERGFLVVVTKDKNREPIAHVICRPDVLRELGRTSLCPREGVWLRYQASGRVIERGVLRNQIPRGRYYCSKSLADF